MHGYVRSTLGVFSASKLQRLRRLLQTFNRRMTVVFSAISYTSSCFLCSQSVAIRFYKYTYLLQTSSKHCPDAVPTLFYVVISHSHRRLLCYRRNINSGFWNHVCSYSKPVPCPTPNTLHLISLSSISRTASTATSSPHLHKLERNVFSMWMYLQARRGIS